MCRSLNFPDAVPVLVGEALYLRELRESDIPAWFERATDSESADLAGDPIPESIELGAQWLQRHRDQFRQQAAIRWAIVLRSSAESIGSVGLAIGSTENGVADLGIVVGRAHWGKGIGRSALSLLKDYAFSSLGLLQLRAEVLQRNLPSLRLLEKVGFRLLGPVPADPQSNGCTEDCLLYVLSKPNQNA